MQVARSTPERGGTRQVLCTLPWVASPNLQDPVPALLQNFMESRAVCGQSQSNCGRYQPFEPNEESPEAGKLMYSGTQPSSRNLRNFCRHCHRLRTASATLLGPALTWCTWPLWVWAGIPIQCVDPLASKKGRGSVCKAGQSGFQAPDFIENGPADNENIQAGIPGAHEGYMRGV